MTKQINQDPLGTRMKEKYEKPARTSLHFKEPVIIRIDGAHFHTFTKGFDKPFDELFMDAMKKTMQYLCKNIHGCCIGFTQSDEITLMLQDYRNDNTSAWFNYQVMKVCSNAAGMATMAFNKFFNDNVEGFIDSYYVSNSPDDNPRIRELISAYSNATSRGGFFDARCFNIPRWEVVNCFIWRQQDAIKNSIQLYGRNYFTDQELQYKKCNEIIEMVKQAGGNWCDLPLDKQRGSVCYKSFMNEDGLERSRWIIDDQIPLFSKNKDYLESIIRSME